MTPGPERVLLFGFGAERAELTQQIRSLGYEASAENEPRVAAARVSHLHEPVRTVLIPADFALPHRGGELDQLSRAVGALGLGFVAVGDRPVPEALAQLRAKNVRLCLWTPFHERELRFVLNRAAFDPAAPALGDSASVEARHALRVPSSIGARVVIGEREKAALVYNVSASGCFLETQRPTLVGAAIEVVLGLPEGELRVAGRVVLTNVPGNLSRPNLPRGMGIEFVRLAPAAHEALERYVAERARLYEI